MPGEYENRKNRKRVAIIAVCSCLLVAMVIYVSIDLSHGWSSDLTEKNRIESISTSAHAIKSICEPTMYPKTCEKSLVKYGRNTTDPKELLKIAFKAAQKEITLAKKQSATLQQLEKDPRTMDALNCCRELMNMSITELQHSFQRVSNLDLSLIEALMNDLKTWLSAAVTYQETCLDGFQNTTTSAGAKMRKALKTAMEMSSNGLDIVSDLSVVLSQLQITGLRRRLLLHQDDRYNHLNFPEWVDAGARRLLSTNSSKIKPNITVAQDGSGDFKTIQAAMSHIPLNSKKMFVLYIKKGIYKEYLVFSKNMTNVAVIGDGPDKTRITGNKNFADGIITYHTATVVVRGDNFMAKNIGFENTAGAIKHQAVALRVSADFAIFFNCSMDGHQETLYAHSKRQFYRDCTISGTIDFVTGDALAVFQNCTFLVRKPLEDQQCVVTAQNRKEKRQPTAIIIQNSTITAHPEMFPVRKQFKTYLGRPSKEFSRTIIMESFIDDVIDAQGWSPWLGEIGLSSCWYAEFNNYGPGSDKKGRVKWNGIKNITRQQAMDFTADRFFDAKHWIKPSGVPYSP